MPFQEKRETETRFLPARVTDNAYNNPEYRKVLESLHGWQRRAWLDGDWDLAAGQYFTSFRREVHIIPDFDETRAREWFAALDYGFAHYTVVLLGCTDGDGNVSSWMSTRSGSGCRSGMLRRSGRWWAGTRSASRALELGDLRRIVAGNGCFQPAERWDHHRGAVCARGHHAETGEHGPGKWLGGGIAKVG